MASVTNALSGHPARFAGVCKSTSCHVSGNQINAGDLIQWTRVGANKGQTKHAECFARDRGLTVSDDIGSTDALPIPNKTPSTRPTLHNASDGLLSMIADAVTPMLEARLKTTVDADTVLELVQGAVNDSLKTALADTAMVQLTRVEIKTPKASEYCDLGLQHKSFPTLLSACSAVTSDGHHLNVWLTGPAGSGKTTAAHNVAQALKLPFAFTGAIDTPYPLLGFIDANGKTVRTPFREVYENGGIFLFDEYDGSSANATLPFNAALANGHCAFPDAIVARHANFIAIAAANTWGLGATTDYVGRNKLDAASLDRFISLSWSIDESLELATSGNPEWTRYVQSVRRAVIAKGIKIIISPPRASYFGSGLLNTGMERDTVCTLTLRKGMTDDQWDSVKKGVSK